MKAAIEIDGDTATLCCGKKRCPTVTLVDGGVVVRDDDGGEVRLRREHVELLLEAVRKLESEP